MDVPEIDYDAPLSPHRQVAAWIRAQIESGEIQPGKKIPSEGYLMQVFGIARGTARRVASLLREEGVIETVPGRGSYVLPR